MFRAFLLTFILLTTPKVWAIDLPGFMSCSNLKNKSCAQLPSPQNIFYSLRVKECEDYQKKYKCDDLRKSKPDIAQKIPTCSPESVCTTTFFRKNLEYKGCFWNNAVEIMDTASKPMLAVSKCMSDPACVALAATKAGFAYLFPGYTGMKMMDKASPYMTKENMGIALSLLDNLGPKSYEWLKTQGVKYQCYDVESQSQMACYAALNIIGGSKTAVEVGMQFPKIMRLLEGAGLKVARSIRPPPTAPIPTGREELAAMAKAAAPRETFGQRVPGTSSPRQMRATDVAAVAPSVEVTAANTFSAGEKFEDRRKTTQVTAGRQVRREALIKKFGDLDVTTPAQNLKYMEKAAKVKATDGAVVMRSENSAMKLLNDQTQDKDIVTAINGYRKSIEIKNLQALEKKYPNFQFDYYSDGKGLEVLVSPRSGLKATAELKADLIKSFEKTNTEFTKYINDLKADGLLRGTDNAGDLFRAGLGATTDQAAVAARYSRQMTGPNIVQSFSNPDIKATMDTALQFVDSYRNDLQKTLGSSTLMETVPGTNKKTFTADIFEAVRKSKDDRELANSIQSRTGHYVTEAQGKQIREYVDLADQFSPPIYSAVRQAPTLEKAEFGAISVDMTGLGAQNIHATAVAVAQSKHVEEALTISSRNIDAVTQNFNANKKVVIDAVTQELGRHDIKVSVAASGDDIVFTPSKPIPNDAKVNIAAAVSQKIDGGSLRMSTINPGIKAADTRTPIATHGETIEKTLRENLRGVIPPERLKKSLFMIRMETETMGSGPVKLLIGGGGPPNDRFSAGELQKIQEKFFEAVKKVNTEYSKKAQPMRYEPSN